MNKLLLALLLCLSISGFSQNKKIEIGLIDSIHSKILNDVQEVWVHVPKPSQYHEYLAPKRYPVVYVLDGDLNFHSITGMVNTLSLDAENGGGVCPEMIVVGILSKNRTRDFTPTKATKGLLGKEERYLRTSGGGEEFTAFIEKELIPYIDSHYPTEQYRMLMGHSFGGLFVINTLVNKPKLFNSYVAIDPSLWWDNNLLLKKATSALQQGKFEDRRLFLAIANTLKEGRDTVLVANDTTASTNHIRANLAFARSLQNHKNPVKLWHWKYYQEEDHFTVSFLAQYDGLRTIFKHKPLPIPEAGVAAPDFQASFVKQHYNNLSTKLGYKVLPPELMVNNFALACMYQDLMEKSYQFLQLNLENYPESFNVYNSLANYYAKAGNKKKAIELFAKALSIKKDPETIQKLNELNISR